MQTASEEVDLFVPTKFSYQGLIDNHAIPVRKAGLGTNLIFEYTARSEDELIMREIGRQREFTFTSAGGGTGKEFDIDKFDVSEKNPYTQLLVWSPELEIILGGYRYIKFKDVEGNLEDNLASTRLFEFSDQFKEEYVPHIVELGRSYVLQGYQATAKDTNARYILKNLWDGIGSIPARDSDITHYFGKVTMYPDRTYPGVRDMLLFYLHKHFEDKEGLVVPIQQNGLSENATEYTQLVNQINYMDDYHIVRKNSNKIKDATKPDGIPPLMKSYLDAAKEITIFGWAVNEHFGNVEEIGLMIDTNNINEKTMEEHIDSYHTNKLPTAALLDEVEKIIK